MRRLLYLVRHRSHDDELREELAAHRALVERDFVARGMAPLDAADAARRAMGNETTMREAARDVWIWPSLSALVQDLRYGMRAIRRAPAFSLVVIGTLALGVGANSAMFGVVDGLLFRPPEGVRAPEQLVRVRIEGPANSGEAAGELSDLASYPDFVDLRDNVRGLDGVAAFLRTTMTVGEGNGARNELTIFSSGSYFPLLGTRAALGRTLAPDDDRANAAMPVAVLSWDFWRRAYGEDPNVLGGTVRVGGRPFTIVGIASRYFVGTEPGAPALWLPLGSAWQLGYDANLTTMRFATWLSLVARLSPGVTPAQADAAARTTLALARGGGSGAVTAGKGVPGGGAPRVEMSSLVGASPAAGDARASLSVSLWFLAITGAVLLVACANVANLLLARASVRSHELAVRVSLGATRGRLVRQLMTESVLLAALGGIGGLLLALAGTALLPRVLPLPALPPLMDGGGRQLGFTLALTLGTTLIFGMAPAIHAARLSPQARLGTGARAGVAGATMRSVLVVVQLSVSVVLLVSALLFLRSLQHVKGIDPGFDIEHLVEASGDTRGVPLTREQADLFWDGASQRIRKLPGVRAASLGGFLPFEVAYQMPVSVPGSSVPPLRGQPDFADATYFETLGLPILEGRPFTAADQHPDAAPVVIINQTLARQLFGGDVAIGRCVFAGPVGPDRSCAVVVGVAADAKFAVVTRDAGPMFFRPMGARPSGGGYGSVLHVRVNGDPAASVGAIQRELLGLDPSLLFVRVHPLADLLAPQIAPWKTASFIFTLFGVLGLALAAIGLYGVIALLVAQRTHELGVRIALGAGRRDVVLLLMGHGARLVAVGLAVGAVGAAAVSRVYASMMYGMSTADPIAYLATVTILATVALGAVYMPARRALRVDPVSALRAS